MEKANIAQGLIRLPNGIGAVMGMDDKGQRVVGRVGSFRMCKEIQEDLAKRGVEFNRDQGRCILSFEELQEKSQIAKNTQQIHAEKVQSK